MVEDAKRKNKAQVAHDIIQRILIAGNAKSLITFLNRSKFAL